MTSNALNGPPRRIEGSVGSRIRVVLGKTGSEWLLILDNDDGDRQWQTPRWSTQGVPPALVTQLQGCTDTQRFVTSVDFGPTGAWFVHAIKRDGTDSRYWWAPAGNKISASIQQEGEKRADLQVAIGSARNMLFQMHDTAVLLYGQNGYKALNLPSFSDIVSRLKKVNTEKKKINFIRLFHSNNYVISDDDGLHWSDSIGTHVQNELGKDASNSEQGTNKVVEVAVASKDGSWIVLRDNNFAASDGVDETLKQSIQHFYHEQSARSNKREQEIRQYHAAQVERKQEIEKYHAAQVEREQAAARGERDQVAARFRLQAERARQQEQEPHARIEKRRQGVRRTNSSKDGAVLERALQNYIIGQAKDIQEEEERIQNDLESLRKRRRSLQESIDKMPPKQKVRVEVEITKQTGETDCIICQDGAPTCAVIPCGHRCLCDDCASALKAADPSKRLCPLCRAPIEGTLKIREL